MNITGSSTWTSCKTVTPCSFGTCLDWLAPSDLRACSDLLFTKWASSCNPQTHLKLSRCNVIIIYRYTGKQSAVHARIEHIFCGRWMIRVNSIQSNVKILLMFCNTILWQMREQTSPQLLIIPFFFFTFLDWTLTKQDQEVPGLIAIQMRNSNVMSFRCLTYMDEDKETYKIKWLFS